MENVMVEKGQKGQGLPSWRSSGVWRVCPSCVGVGVPTRPPPGFHEPDKQGPTLVVEGKSWWPS